MRPISMSIFMAISMLFTGCGVKQDQEKEKAAAEAVATNLFATIQLGDFDSAMTFYSSSFFQETSKDEWKAMLRKLQNNLGTLKNYELVTLDVKKNSYTSGSGIYWVLQYIVTYSKYLARETITVFKLDDGQFKIHGHNIKSTVLLKE